MQIAQTVHTINALYTSIAYRKSINTEIKKLAEHRATHDEINACRALYTATKPRFWRTLTRVFIYIIRIARDLEKQSIKKFSISKFKRLIGSAYKNKVGCYSKNVGSEFQHAGV
ncbi:MAG: hypothetical protein HYR97_06610 [Candidatus Melainabacteria bacterium]|nr:hypothetical protein [Candidatus Melainabacteria bacterium]